MAVPHVLNKQFQNFGGLNLRVSDLLRQAVYATSCQNSVLRSTGALSKRKGWQILTETKGGYGLTTFANTDVETGQVTDELLNLDQNMHKLTESTITITYSGAGTSFYDIYLHTDSNFYFDIYDDGERVLNYSLGSGKESSFVTVANLITAINGVTDFSASTTATTTDPAAFIPIEQSVSISTGGTLIPFKEWEQVDTPNGHSNPFANHYAARNDDGFENASFATINNALYISNGYDDMHKYDGLRTYKAGLPSPSAEPSTNLVAGALTGSYKYRYFYRYTDAKGNIIESNASTREATTLSPSTQNVEVTVNNIQSSSGYNTDQAVVNGAQTGVNTITVDSGHSIKSGDKVYLYNGSSSEFITRNVTGITATTITIDGTTVNVADNAIINPQLKIVIVRTVSSGSLYYEVVELVNASANANQTYTDSTADSALVIEYTDPSKDHDLPPKCRYMDVWRGTLVMTGDRTNVNTVYYSDIDSPEYFPSGDNSFTTETQDGTKNTGIKSIDNLLFVFKRESIIGVTGDLATDAFAVNNLSQEGIGCIAAKTIQEINGRIFFLSRQGIYSVAQDGLKPESDNIEPKFAPGHLFTLEKAHAHRWINEDKYVLVLPVISESGSTRYVDSSSEILALDTFRGGWMQWSSFDITGGATEYEDSLFFVSRDVDVLGNNSNLLKKVHNNNNTYDYADHEEAITFSYKTHWESLGEPSVFKKFLRIKVHSLDITNNDFESAGFDLDVKTEHDYEAITVSELTLDFSGGADGWGVSPWGEFHWGEARLPGLKSKLASKKARSMRVVFENNNASENILVSGFELQIATPYQLNIKE